MVLGLFLTYTVVGALMAAPFLPAGTLAMSAEAQRVQDAAWLGNTSVKTFEVGLAGTETSRNTTLMLPLNASAKILSAQVTVGGRIVIPEAQVTNLTGRGTAAANREEFGHGVHGGGDYNDDGYDDLAVGAYAESSGGDAPRVEVFWGSPVGLMGRVANWTFDGPTGTGFGWAITHGDYNDDGIDDLVVGESDIFGNAPSSETLFVFFGSGSGLPANASATFVISTVTHYRWGYSLAGGFDIDSDGYDDLVVGEAFNSSVVAYQGGVQVLWGSATGLDLAVSTWLTGFVTQYQGTVTSPGLFLEALGDTDADGYGEFAIGTPWDGANLGSVDVYEGGAARALTSVFSYTNAAPGFLGWSLGGGRDITGDGIADLAAGAPIYGTNGNGAVFVFSGAGSATYNAPTMIAPLVTTTTDQFGSGLDMLADFDGDGKDELAVGSNAYGNFDGRVYIYSGHGLSTAAASILRPNSTGLQESFGWLVQSVGDLNNDGLGDLAVHLTSGRNGTFAPGGLRVYLMPSNGVPRDVTVYLNTTPVWTQSGVVSGPVNVSGLGSALQSYLDAHAADANASGVLLIPLSFNFSGGGRLNVSNIAIAYTVVLPPPGVRATAPGVGGSIVISWNLQATDGALYSIWSNKSGSWAIIGNVSFPRTFYNDTNVTDGLTYWYYVTEWDTSVPLQSVPSPIVSASPGDVIPPLLPANFVIARNGTAHTITLQWSANGDDTVRYEIWRHDESSVVFALLGTVPVPGTSYVDASLLEEMNYTYQIRAVDDVGLLSGFTAPLTERIPDLTPPATPVNFQGAPHPSGTAVVLSWDFNTGDTVAYAVLRSLTGLAGTYLEVGQTAGATFTAGGLVRSQMYYFELVAIDKADLRSPATAAISVVTADTEAPAAPVITGVSVLPAGNGVQVTWTALGDDIAGFRVYSNATGAWGMVLQLAGVARTAAVLNLTDGAPAFVRITGFDLGGREGPPSNEASATPADTQRPAAPTGLSVSAPAQGASLLLVWSPPADSDVTGYKVWYIDPTVSAAWVLAGSVSGPATFLHSGLKNGIAYRYQVSALDEVPNEGAPSGTASGTPKDSIPPSAPRITTPFSTTNVVNLGIEGTSEPNMEIELWVRGTKQADATADADGNWNAVARLITGDNAIYAVAVDPSPIIEPAAKSSEDSQTLHVVLDPTRPTASTTSPPSGATGIDPAAPLVVTFSEDIQVGSVQIRLTDPAGNAVDGTLTVDAANKSARFVPLAPLSASTTYRATVNATDLAGNAMAPLSVTFTTAATAGSTGGGGGFLPGFEGALGVAALAGVALLAGVSRGWRKGR